MTQEKIELLLKDLCARLPYGAFVQFEVDGQKTIKPLNMDVLSSAHIKCFKPYLRPMSSMTEEEREEWHETFDSVYDLVPGGDPDNEDDYDDNWHEQPGIESYDYLISHHFDYRGLIKKGLALEAPKDMYKTD